MENNFSNTSKRSNQISESELSTSFSSTETIDDSFNIAFPGQNANITDFNSLNKESNNTHCSSFHFQPIDNQKLQKSVSLNSFRRESLSMSKNTSPGVTDTISLIMESNKNNEKLMEVIQVLTEKNKTLNKENQALQKQILDLKGQNSLQNLVETQKRQIEELMRENLKLELDFDEAAEIIKHFENDLEDIRTKYRIVGEKYTEIQNSLTIDPNERFQYPPDQLFELYSKQLMLNKKQDSQINNLLEETNFHKICISDLKKHNSGLEEKVRILAEGDINRKILDFTIKENKKLEQKIEIQTETNILRGFEYKNEKEKLQASETENHKLKKKIKKLQKNTNKLNESIEMIEDDGWETTSESISDHDSSELKTPVPASNCKKLATSSRSKTNPPSPNLGKNVRFSNIANSKSKTKSPNSNLGKNVQISNIANSPKKEEKKIHTNDAKTTEPYKKQNNLEPIICKFHLQNRCHFGQRCRNIHQNNQSQARNNVPSWLKNYYFPYQFNNKPLETYSSPNRFENLSSVNIDSGSNSKYWSAPQFPDINCKTIFPNLSVTGLNAPNRN